MIPGLYTLFQEKWADKQAIWVYSDPHFGDKELAAGTPDRPSDEEQIKLINSKVGKKDVLIILGDCGDPTMCAKLRGYKVLIMGNHDAGRSNYEKKVISRKFPKEIFQKSGALDEMKRIYPDCQYSITEKYDFRSPFEYWEVFANNNLFDEIYEGPLMLGEKLILSHEPLPMMPWVFNIHGHTHSGPIRQDKYHFNVCSDVISYNPVNLNQLLKNGLTSKIYSVHRQTIDVATKNKKRREQKRGNN